MHGPSPGRSVGPPRPLAAAVPSPGLTGFQPFIEAESLSSCGVPGSFWNKQCPYRGFSWGQGSEAVQGVGEEGEEGGKWGGGLMRADN